MACWSGRAFRGREDQLIWFDRAGKQVGTVGPPIKGGLAEMPRLSPDGKRVATAPVNPQTLNQDVWVIDLARDLPTRLTFDPARDVNPIWSPDGSRVVYFSVQRKGIYQRAANGAGPEELLLEVTSIATSDWSPDGRFILYSLLDERTGRDVWAVPLTGSRQPYPLLNTQFDEYRAQLSPDGHWLAYVSDESGSYEVYVQPFTADGKLGGDKQRISTGGGNQSALAARRRGAVLRRRRRANDGRRREDERRDVRGRTPKALFKTRMLRWDAPMIWALVRRDGRRAAVPDRDDGRRGRSGQRDPELDGRVEKMTIATRIHPGSDEIIIPLGAAAGRSRPSDTNRLTAEGKTLSTRRTSRPWRDGHVGQVIAAWAQRKACRSRSSPHAMQW